MLPAAIERDIPLVIGSAGGAGAAPHLAWTQAIIEGKNPVYREVEFDANR